ncbi:MAG: M48 family metalloprotease [Elusimicrobiota bacterium]|jgi:heat shock protein HtpX
MKKSIAVVLITALLVGIQGPAVTSAAAQVVQSAASFASPVANVPAGLGSLPIGSGLQAGGPAAMGASLSLEKLPALTATPDVAARVQAAVQSFSPALPAAPEAPAPASAALTPAPRKSSGGSLGYRALRAYAERERAIKKSKKLNEDGDQKLIERVVAISDSLEARELGSNPSSEAMRTASDSAWDATAKAAASEAAQTPAEESSPAGSGLVAPAAQTGAEASADSRAPPRPHGKLRSMSAGLKGLLILGLRAVFSSKAAPEAAKPEVADARPSRILSAVSSVLDPLSGPVRVAVVATASVVLDFAARTLLPTVFGLAPVAGAWVVAGIGAVVAPLLIADRVRLGRQKDGALLPLKKYEDVLLGAFFGAAFVAALGALSAGLPLGALVFGAFGEAAGAFALAPFLGLLALMSALPILYSSGQMAYGLIHKVLVKPELPLPFLFKLLLFNIVLTPGQFFMYLLGPISLPFTAAFLGILPALMYFQSSKRLVAMSKRNASEEELAVEKQYAQQPWTRGLLGPDPEYGPEWNVGNGAFRPEAVEGAIRRAKVRSYAWLLAMFPILLALFGAFHMSFAPLAGMVPSILHQMKIAVPMFMASGFIAPLFMGAKHVKDGPVVDMVSDLAKRAGLPMPRVYAGKDEKKSPNAFASGALYHLSVVAVIGSIRKLLTDRELRGVLGHELSHVKFRHMLMFLAAIVLIQLMNFGEAATVFQMALSVWAPAVWLLSFLAVMRSNEYMADAGSARIVKDPRALATGLRKLVLMGALTNKVPGSAGSWFYRLFLTHPTSTDRVNALNGMMDPAPGQGS